MVTDSLKVLLLVVVLLLMLAPLAVATGVSEGPQGTASETATIAQDDHDDDGAYYKEAVKLKEMTQFMEMKCNSVRYLAKVLFEILTKKEKGKNGGRGRHQRNNRYAL